MIVDLGCDMLDGTGELCVEVWRCLLCGERIDPVIVANRANPPEPDRSARRAPGPVATARIGSRNPPIEDDRPKPPARMAVPGQQNLGVCNLGPQT